MYAEQTLKHTATSLKHTATLEKMSDFRTKTFQAFFVNHEASHTDFPIQKDVSLNLNCLSHINLHSVSNRKILISIFVQYLNSSH